MFFNSRNTVSQTIVVKVSQLDVRGGAKKTGSRLPRGKEIEPILAFSRLRDRRMELIYFGVTSTRSGPFEEKSFF
jgi:hypothetical protein